MGLSDTLIYWNFCLMIFYGQYDATDPATVMKRKEKKRKEKPTIMEFSLNINKYGGLLR